MVLRIELICLFAVSLYSCGESSKVKVSSESKQEPRENESTNNQAKIDTVKDVSLPNKKSSDLKTREQTSEDSSGLWYFGENGAPVQISENELAALCAKMNASGEQIVLAYDSSGKTTANCP